MIILKTHTYNPRTIEFWKWVARVILHKRSGPLSVLESLSRGLSDSSTSFIVDPFLNHQGTTIVLSGQVALAEAITQKKKSKKPELLLAGPNVFTSSLESDALIYSKEIDIILTPSQWTVDFARETKPLIADKLRIWAAGVAKAPRSTRDGAVIIYDKIGNAAQVQELVDWHENNTQQEVVILTYGKFTREKYFKNLKSAPYLIYLATSETQGIAQQEAWAHDVPTYVHYSGQMKTKDEYWADDRINAPYVTDALGGFFKNVNELKSLLKENHLRRPQNYCEETFSDSASAKALLNIIENNNIKC